jgi:hypothetical protein
MDLTMAKAVLSACCVLEKALTNVENPDSTRTGHL